MADKFLRPVRTVHPVAALLKALLIWVAVFACSAEPIDCQDCHDDTILASPSHPAFQCQNCHTNITSRRHRRRNIEGPTGDEICGQCHEKGAPLPTVPHGEVGCGDCHGPPHQVEQASESSCVGCHATPAKAAGQSAHAEIVGCGDCHGKAHEIVSGTNLASSVSPVNQIRVCGSCHTGSPAPVDSYLRSVHASALLVSGLASAPACSDCHGSHDILPGSDPLALTSPRRAPETCGNCHTLILQEWRHGSSHGLAWEKGREGPVCTTCHASHAIADPHAAATHARFPETCRRCHESYYTSFRDSFHGKATDLGFIAAATCEDCHRPHGNLPAGDPRSSVNPANLRQTCGRCHGTVRAAFLSFDPHNDPRNSEDSPEVHYLWLLMNALLFGVFGFFGVHSLLWLQRAVVGAVRGEFGWRREQDEFYVRRFSNVHVRTHIVVVASFMVLAGTGLPLKYHAAPWAQYLVDLIGGLEAARVIHRLAALATFGYAGFHLGHLFVRSVLSKERGLFWGPDSLVPQPRDLADFLANLKYFLYLGPRPAFDRWSYWEKFDYLAVFWGVLIIGLSGLVLWLPNFFSALLPGWTLNAAYLVHSEEALLATGFIFLVHFFHTHLRPGSFPMDPVIFTGRMPVERFKLERPLEYGRWVEDGTLAAHLVPPPTASERRRAYAFGMIAVTVGLALAAGILWGLLLA